VAVRSARKGPSQNSDRELVDATQRGDVDAFGILVRRYQQRVYGLAYQFVRCRAEAEDVTQETFLRAYQAMARFDLRHELVTWLFRIAVNLSLNSIRDRRAKRYSTTFDDDEIQDRVSETPPTYGRDPDRATYERQMAQALSEGIEMLSPTLRVTLILVCIDGLEQVEVAAILGCPEGTVSWRVHEARRKLHEYLATRGFGGDA
jgi:RNA polymerase sigma-70 factor (ECF subfamily)